MAVEAQKIAPAEAARGFLGQPRRGLVTGALLAPPVPWLGVFFLLPVAFIFLYSINVFAFIPGTQSFSLDVWRDFLDGSVYLDVFWRSVKMSAIVSVVAVVLAYPIAYFLALCAGKRKYMLLLLILTPFLVSYFLRLLAWRVILGDQGPINRFAYWLGLRDPDDPIPGLTMIEYRRAV